jgi:hypothetical protein
MDGAIATGQNSHVQQFPKRALFFECLIWISPGPWALNVQVPRDVLCLAAELFKKYY